MIVLFVGGSEGDLLPERISRSVVDQDEVGVMRIQEGLFALRLVRRAVGIGDVGHRIPFAALEGHFVVSVIWIKDVTITFSCNCKQYRATVI